MTQFYLFLNKKYDTFTRWFFTLQWVTQQIACIGKEIYEFSCVRHFSRNWKHNYHLPKNYSIFYFLQYVLSQRFGNGILRMRLVNRMPHCCQKTSFSQTLSVSITATRCLRYYTARWKLCKLKGCKYESLISRWFCTKPSHYVLSLLKSC